MQHRQRATTNRGRGRLESDKHCDRRPEWPKTREWKNSKGENNIDGIIPVISEYIIGAGKTTPKHLTQLIRCTASDYVRIMTIPVWVWKAAFVGRTQWHPNVLKILSHANHVSHHLRNDPAAQK